MFHSCNSYDARSIPFWKVLFTWRYLASAGSPDAVAGFFSEKATVPSIQMMSFGIWSFILS